jgi:hypothetical protein
VDPIYRLNTSSTYGPTIRLVSGAMELLLSTRLDHLMMVYAALAPHQ